MNENILNALDEFTAVICFLLAISILIMLNQSTIKLLEAFNPDKYSNHGIIQGSFESNRPLISGGEILLQVYDGLEYDICVEGKYISRSTEIKDLDPSILKMEGKYLGDHILDTSGRIILINYRLNRNEGM